MFGFPNTSSEGLQGLKILPQGRYLEDFRRLGLLINLGRQVEYMAVNRAYRSPVARLHTVLVDCGVSCLVSLLTRSHRILGTGIYLPTLISWKSIISCRWNIFSPMDPMDDDVTSIEIYSFPTCELWPTRIRFQRPPWLKGNPGRAGNSEPLKQTIQGEPLLVVSRFITSSIGVVTPVLCL